MANKLSFFFVRESENPLELARVQKEIAAQSLTGIEFQDTFVTPESSALTELMKAAQRSQSEFIAFANQSANVHYHIDHFAQLAAVLEREPKQSAVMSGAIALPPRMPLDFGEETYSARVKITQPLTAWTDALKLSNIANGGLLIRRLSLLALRALPIRRNLEWVICLQLLLNGERVPCSGNVSVLFEGEVFLDPSALDECKRAFLHLDDLHPLLGLKAVAESISMGEIDKELQLQMNLLKTQHELRMAQAELQSWSASTLFRLHQDWKRNAFYKWVAGAVRSF